MHSSNALSPSIECPTMVSANGGSPAMGIIEELTETQCRMRSINVFAIGDTLTFDFTMRGVPTLALSGRVMSSATNGPRRSYIISLHTTGIHDHLKAAIEAARKHAGAHPPIVAPAPAGLIRSSVRVAIDIDIQYTAANAMPRAARMTNISTGGILMNSDDDIAVGTEMELRFRLPGASGDTRVHGRVVAHQHTTPNYNVAFHGLNDATRADIGRFVENVAPA